MYCVGQGSDIKDGLRPDQVGAVRVVVQEEGPTADETLRELSDLDQRTVYQLTGGDLPNMGAIATLPLRRKSQPTINWHIGFDAAGDPAPFVDAFCNGFLRTRSDEMEWVLLFSIQVYSESTHCY